MVLFHEARLHHQIAVMRAEKKAESSGRPVQPEVLEGDLARRIDKYVRRSCGINSVDEENFEADSWAKRSNKPEEDKELAAEVGLKWKDIV